MIVLCSVCAVPGEESSDGISDQSHDLEVQGFSESFQIDTAGSGTIVLERIQAFADQRPGPRGDTPVFHNGRMRAPETVPVYDAGRMMVQHPGVVVQDNMPDRKELSDLLKQNIPVVNGISYLQEHVTPHEDAVLSYLEEEGLDDRYEIYKTSISWVWVSDTTLSGRQEAWLTPEEFLYDSPDYTSNPLPGTIVSDCEDQANALASLLIASGEYDESSVRVAIGEVRLGAATGGHAWVEVYEDGQWLPLDATAGPYYDDGEKLLVTPDSSETDYYHFRDEGYSVLEIWYYYNNEYFIDLENRVADAPDNWMSTSSSYY
ncbi:MAG: transglutaminase domain-containing protein [Methanosarcinaceae archaeon]|nr:transglutaminase domain-containing protein [Methanosarcinaceae archaeon]